MSRHSFKTERDGQPVDVTMGWDRPLQEFFLRVNVGDDQVYDSLEEDAGDSPLAHYRATLARLKIQVPESLFSEVERDQERNAGNRMVRHHRDGTFEVLMEG